MAVRVLWVVKGLGPGGAEVLLAAAAESHDHSRFEIECAYVLPFKDHLVARLERAGVLTTCVSRRRADRWWPLRLARLVRAGRFDVVHVHSPLPGSVARLAARSMRSRPYIVATEHNSWGTFAVPTRLLNRLTSRWNDVTIAVSQEARVSITGKAARHAIALVHGIDVTATAALSAERGAVRAELGIGPDEFVIGTVANFRPQKDYPNLLAAARRYLDDGGAARWLVVGQGPLEADTRDEAVRLGLGDAVVFTGYRADGARVQSAFDIFTMASRWEGLPVALMEALALGLPVAATDVGGVGETLTNGVDGLLVPPGEPEALADAWARLAESTGLRSEIAAAGAKRAAEFDVARVTTLVEAEYAKLAGSDPIVETPLRPASQRRVSSGVEIRPAVSGDHPAILALLSRSLGWDDDPRFAELFRWKHVDNVFGPSPGWVACADDRVVAVRLFMRWEFERDGERIRAARAVDTATDPEWQGKGLFTALTLHGLESLREDGVAFVFNTPNEQSRPGYIKMGWREVGRLPVAVRPRSMAALPRLAKSRVPADHWSIPTGIGISIEDWLDGEQTVAVDGLAEGRSLRTARSDRYLRWRFGLPSLHYRFVGGSEGGAVVRLRRRGAAVELVEAMRLQHGGQSQTPSRRALRESGADHLLRVGSAGALNGFVRPPGLGPMLTWREVNLNGMPPLANWCVEMADIELM